ncbi:bifunctional 2-C-methyl-D-erythritol 4-phosphate cytidylyltransferase/2-C-methyl-D-erythritol 2,4-cyclodiphosphate synthase [Novosphingobium pituita]|uniref:Bifunctional enzyme IspD/IspF n=1 Tax=Novosphingobium pituita TaxID=3056842 RepID=A0ABQ6P468_9SPHN|nr:bifunctional 2-C-methyl-D-erythritol 4-phosphate cytidylyltransferase/2-C-methyl-D-erythritol 2,4-cyclodiphosphate synthase [Novosphingobium sp. IK01]MDK4806341.1 bifunctional 2-C-methyl-D-erythritol 4-phosphate cytidylyltransferase/2-C-methyl-D-erythritol 2,4-cyclodiphosphate synthase [Novosphingobium aromaticivorans]GMM60043.1 bifunctional 2-C-methyl-D-erythritol 4-phosphate cytidylyltransferase/2-C-methyl-D-erythritol 2,4-cyclodiphosphate synthase [Novosphingobium sp. IK01]
MTTPPPPSPSVQPSPAAPSAAAIVVAAGKGLRAGGAVPKQFAIWHGKPLVRHSVEALVAAGIAPIVVAIPAGWEQTAAASLQGLPDLVFIHGGATRQESVAHALEALADSAPAHVLIHDAARPVLPAAVIAGLIAALDTVPGAIPVLPVVDSVVRGAQGLRDHMVAREDLYRVQTPQAFHYDAILAAHRAWGKQVGEAQDNKPAEAGDDAQVAAAAGLAVALVPGDEALRKVTFASDLETETMPVAPTAPIALPRTGMGFDVHRLESGQELWLCGIKIDHTMGLSGHSDADVAIHALVDAILGAIAAGDIGDHFPPSDPQWKGASSDRFLAHAAHLVDQSGHQIAHVDVTIICEAPKIGPHKAAMRARLAEILKLPLDRVSVKATTTERLGLTGRGEGIAAQAVATVMPK